MVSKNNKIEEEEKIGNKINLNVNINNHYYSNGDNLNVLSLYRIKSDKQENGDAKKNPRKTFTSSSIREASLKSGLSNNFSTNESYKSQSNLRPRLKITTCYSNKTPKNIENKRFKSPYSTNKQLENRFKKLETDMNGLNKDDFLNETKNSQSQKVNKRATLISGSLTYKSSTQLRTDHLSMNDSMKKLSDSNLNNFSITSYPLKYIIPNHFMDDNSGPNTNKKSSIIHSLALNHDRNANYSNNENINGYKCDEFNAITVLCTNCQENIEIENLGN